MGLFDGKVVIVTGAGGGIGRAHALEFAREGAKVVVNDLGGTRDGSGGGSAMADQVVAEIVELGAEAVPNYDDVSSTEGGLSILKTTLDAFGRVDILVNNAGIIRDKTFAKMEEGWWDLVIRVHTRQLFAVTQPVVRWMLENDVKGRIVSTSSLAGLLGNYGQTNYATAKAGTAGFTRTLAKELRKKGITVNAVAPVAKTRMTEDIDMVPGDMVPEQISKMVLYLASDLASGVTGRVFGVHGQQIFEYVMHQTPGATKKGADHWSVDEIHDRFGDITREESAAAAPAGADDPVTAAFGCIPAGLKADDAKGWSAVIQWKIKGGPDQTLSIADGVCTHTPGLTGTATCTVKTDTDTVVGMFKGEIDPTKAFMAGKISADNLPDMMKMGSVFDFQAIGAAIAALDAGGASDPVADAFAVLPHAFLADKAGDWSTVVHFEIKGGTDHTLTVGGGEAVVSAGLNGDPACVVKTDVDTIVGMFDGSVDGTAAFMGGKITATDLGVLMKFSQVFKTDAEAAKKAAAASGKGSAPKAKAPAKKGIDLRDAIGRRYSGDYVVVDQDSMVAYALATNDPNPRYVEVDRADGTVAPPLYPVRLFHGLVMQCVGDPDLNLDVLRLVHGEEDLTWHGPLHAGDIVNLRAELQAVSQKSKGCVIGFRLFGVVGGETRVEAFMSVFVRGQMLDGVEPGTTFGSLPTPHGGEATGDPLVEADVEVAADQPARYAAASLDDNPIHLDENVAKSAGLPTVILHGLCTMAFASTAVVDGVLAGNSERLRRLAVRFTKPVLPGWTLTTKVWDAGTVDNGNHGYHVQVENQDGVVVAGNGWAEVAPQPGL